MDYRIRFLEFLKAHPLTFSITTCIIFTTISIAGLALDPEGSCKAVIKVWLAVAVARLILRLFVRLYIEGIVMNYINFHQNILFMQKVLDILDVFGFVWFAVGNLLVFNSILCITSAPICFSMGLLYLLVCYLVVAVPTFLKCSLHNFPPRSVEDMNYLRGMFTLNNEAEREGGRGGGGGALDDIPFLNQMNITEQSVYWKTWLEGRGCKEFLCTEEHYRKLLNIHASEKKELNLGGADVPLSSSNDTTVLNSLSTDSTTNLLRSRGLSNENPIETMEEARLEDENGEQSPFQSAENTSKKLEENENAPTEEAAQFSMQQSALATMMQSLLTSAPVSTEDSETCLTCAICLTPFEIYTETVSVYVSSPQREAVSNSMDRSFGNDIEDQRRAEMSVVEINNSNHGGLSSPSTDTVNPNCLLVQYPCNNAHFFHAHCLKHWLHVCGRRGGQFITCPCCRQPPRTVNPVEAEAALIPTPNTAAITHTQNTQSSQHDHNNNPNSNNNNNNNNNDNHHIIT